MSEQNDIVPEAVPQQDVVPQQDMVPEQKAIAPNYNDSITNLKENFTYENVKNVLLALENCELVTLDKTNDEWTITFKWPKLSNRSCSSVYFDIKGRDNEDGSFHQLLYKLSSQNPQKISQDEISKIRRTADAFNKKFGDMFAADLSVGVREKYRGFKDMIFNRTPSSGGKRTKRKVAKKKRTKKARGNKAKK